MTQAAPIPPSPLTRVIVVPLIQNDRGQYLICKKPKALGVFPGQWGLPGGGIEANETMEEALRREIHEEVGLEVSEIKPLFFTDGIYPKFFADGSQHPIYMIFLVFSCRATSSDVKLNLEFEAYAWVDKEALKSYDLNSATIETFHRVGILEDDRSGKTTAAGELGGEPCYPPDGRRHA